MQVAPSGNPVRDKLTVRPRGVQVAKPPDPVAVRPRRARGGLPLPLPAVDHLAQPAVRRVQCELVANGARPLPPLLVGDRPNGGQVLVVEEVGRVVVERVGEEEARRVREVAQVQRPAVPGADQSHGDYGHAEDCVGGKGPLSLDALQYNRRASSNEQRWRRGGAPTPPVTTPPDDTTTKSQPHRRGVSRRSGRAAAKFWECGCSRYRSVVYLVQFRVAKPSHPAPPRLCSLL